MAQVRFNIGIPRAGSAARESEAAGNDFRSLRPAAGSAARQAEQERRESDREGIRYKPMATLRVQSEPFRAEVVQKSPDVEVRIDEGARTIQVEGNTELYPDLPEARQGSSATELSNQHGAASAKRADAVVTPSSPDSVPMHTAADRFKSLLRSVFQRNAGES